MENSHANTPEPSPSLDTAYEQNHATLLNLIGRVIVGLSRRYQQDKPRTGEHTGVQEEMIDMLTDIVDYLQA